MREPSAGWVPRGHWLDHAWCRWGRGPAIFAEGWGDPAVVPRLEARAAAFQPPPPARIEWLEEPRRVAGGTARRGRFPSPFDADLLPPESRTAFVEVLTPTRPRAMVVHMAGVGDEGFRRRGFLAGPLLRRGIGAVILENPFYGARRPRGQQGVALREVAQQFVMNVAAVDEALALVGWLRAEGHVPAVTGYSQGGYTASLVAAYEPDGVAAVPCAAGISAADIFTRGLMAQHIAWSRLAEGAGEGDARARMAALLDKASLDRLRLPRRPDAVVLVGARRDGYVDPRSVEMLNRHWTGSVLRWLPGGHVSSVVTGRRAMAAAVEHALERFERR